MDETARTDLTLCLERTLEDRSIPEYVLVYSDGVVAITTEDSHREAGFSDVGSMLAALNLTITDLASAYKPVALQEIKLPQFSVMLVDETGKEIPLVAEPERSLIRATALLHDVRAHVPDSVIQERGELVIAVVP